MATKLLGMAKRAAGLLMIELLLPGGTLVVLGLLMAGGSLPARIEKQAAVRLFLNWVRR